MLIFPPSSSDLKSSSLLLEMYFPRLAVHNGMCFSIQQTECVCLCCVLYTHNRAGKRPLAASLPATLALGHRRCLIGCHSSHDQNVRLGMMGNKSKGLRSSRNEPSSGSCLNATCAKSRASSSLDNMGVNPLRPDTRTSTSSSSLNSFTVR